MFAESGVRIADKIGVVDYLSFGSEVGDIETLVKISDNMLSSNYEKALSNIISGESGKTKGYPAACEKAYNSVFSERIPSDFFSANNILALEYIKALKSVKSMIVPHTIKRMGAKYRDESLQSLSHQSATAIRNRMKDDIISAIEYLPENAKDVVLISCKSGEAPCDQDKLSSAIISYFRLNPTLDSREIHDAGGGLYNRLQSASLKANSISSLTELADTKKYTTARIRRAIWYSFFGVTSSEVKQYPLYTQVLAMDNVGKAILKSIKKVSDFPVVTKPSAYDFLSESAKRQKEKSGMADAIFELTKPIPGEGDNYLRRTPFIMD